jgi:hypothetical protein
MPNIPEITDILPNMYLEYNVLLCEGMAVSHRHSFPCLYGFYQHHSEIQKFLGDPDSGVLLLWMDVDQECCRSLVYCKGYYVEGK